MSWLVTYPFAVGQLLAAVRRIYSASVESGWENVLLPAIENGSF